MHEMAITKSILNICLEEEKKYNFNKVKEINIKVGELTCLVPDCINYYFNIISKGTVAENASINVIKMPIVIKCGKCDYSGAINLSEYECPKCRSYDFKIIEGNEFYLESMEVL